MTTPDWVLEKPRRGAKAKYPFATMEFATLAIVEVSQQDGTFESFQRYAYNRGRILGRKFATRVNPENGNWEIWRSL